MSNGALRDLLVRSQFWMLEAQFVIVIVSAVVALKGVRCRRLVLAAALVLGVSAWILTATLPPRTNRIFYDEHIYQGVALSMSDSHLTQLCNEGQVETGRLHCLRGEYNKEPPGYPYLLSLAFRIGGVNELWAHRLNNIGAGAAVLVAMALAMSLFRSVFAAIVAGVVLTLVPMQLTWSNTAAAEPIASLTSGAAVLAAVFFARVRSRAAMTMMVAITSFAATMRPESVLIVPLVVVAVLVLAPDEWARSRLWGGGLIGLLLVLPVIVHLIAVWNEGWGISSSRLSLHYAVDNLPVNFWFYFADHRFPTLIGCAAVVGAFGRDYFRERLVLVLYFLTFWTIFIFFYAGSYNYGADVRYSLLSYIPMAVLAGAGLERVALALAHRINRSVSRRAVLLVTLAALMLQFLWYAPLVRETGEEAWAARADVAYARRFAGALPRNSIVLTHNPSMFLLWGVDAAQLSILVEDPAYVRDRLFTRYGGGVYLHWNFWCNVADPVQVQLCDSALQRLPHELTATYRERDYRFAMYRLRRD